MKTSTNGTPKNPRTGQENAGRERITLAFEEGVSPYNGVLERPVRWNIRNQRPKVNDRGTWITQLVLTNKARSAGRKRKDEEEMTENPAHRRKVKCTQCDGTGTYHYHYEECGAGYTSEWRKEDCKPCNKTGKVTITCPVLFYSKFGYTTRAEALRHLKLVEKSIREELKTLKMLGKSLNHYPDMTACLENYIEHFNDWDDEQHDDRYAW